jgi:hypothetical protein
LEEYGMKQSSSMNDLEFFARECINSSEYPDDYHVFSLFACNSCKSAVFRLTIEYHTGSEDWDFKGIIWGECTGCGYLMRLFTYTGESRQKLREERPLCDCGNRDFVAGLCERIEGEQGIPGFFDEGVVVGKCTQCKRNKAFVYTD